MPINIAVEGANILTRNLIIFGQGSVRCHLTLLDELHAVACEDEKAGVKAFDKSLIKHIGYTSSNIVRAFILGLSCGQLVRVSGKRALLKYQRKLSWLSTSFAMVSDLALIYLGGALKRKEMLSARLGDVLSYLYMGSCVVKYYEKLGDSQEKALAQYSLDWCLYQAGQALLQFFDNFPNRPLAFMLKWISFPFGQRFHFPKDEQAKAVADIMQMNSAIRERLLADSFVNKDKPNAVTDIRTGFSECADTSTSA